MSQIIRKEIDLAGRKLILETGKFASQANSSVLATYGQTVVLTTVCSAPARPELDYFPLSVEYVEKLYAGGRISSSRFIKREGRPSDEAILTGRLIDRSIRPLFPKDYFNEVQVIITVLSHDQENDPDILSIIAASAVLTISAIPWAGPIGALRVGYKEGSFLLNPQNSELDFSELDLVVSGSDREVVMVEAGAKQISESIMISALDFAQEQMGPIIKLIEEFAKETGQEKQKYEVAKMEEDTEKAVLDYIQEEFISKLDDPKTALDETWGDKSKENLYALFGEKAKPQLLAEAFDKAVKKFVRHQIVDEGRRLDGRNFEEIRPLSIETGVLPRTHGSALFQRGDTQALTIVTLGTPSLEQLIEGPTGEEKKRYMHHYNFPPFSTGQVKRIGSVGRREIGHGRLAERALVPVIPSEEQFPYAIRVVSEILSSSGSTSMASVCGSTLALMDAGVPLVEPVAGIAMGLITDKDKAVVLTDIGYSEDANGDMDFKVAGTKNGITALQMDIKLLGVKKEILAEALEKAKKARLFILDKMLSVLPQTREELSFFAPRVQVFHIDPGKIGEVIGSGGKTINNIIEKTGTAVDIENDGKVMVSGKNDESVKKAVEWIQGLLREVQPGEVFEGQVKRILPFGAFVEILPGKEGLVHISQLAPFRVEKVEDVVQIGQTLKVRVVEIDSQGRLNLSAKFGEEFEKEQPTQGFQDRNRPFNNRRPFRPRR